MKQSTELRAAISRTRIRPLTAADLDALVAIDKGVSGRARPGFYEKRLARLARDPSAFVALGAERDGKIAGFIFARLYEGEFGSKRPEAALDAIGVAVEMQRQGIGRLLLDGMMAAMRIHGIAEIATQTDWFDTDLAAFFAEAGFALAPRLVLERSVGETVGAVPSPRTKSPRVATGAEVDYSNASGDDFAALSHDRVPIRSMTSGDVAGMLAIDRRITGHDRTPYFKRKAAEAMDESGIRVSLVAEIDGEIGGFVMARVEFGEFGNLEPEAVLDTIGVAASHGHKGVGSALISQLMTNLVGLRIEHVRTEVDWNHFGLLSFLDRMGFHPYRRLALRRVVGR